MSLPVSWPFALPAAVTPRRDATRSGVQQKRPRSPSPSPEPEPDDSECFICADAPACVVLTACGHGGMCEVCCEKWRKAERKAKRSPAGALCKTYVLPGSCVTAADASSAYVAGRVDPAAAAAAAAYTLLVKKTGETVCFETGSGLNVRDRHGWTLLHHACDSGLSNCLRMLLLAGADAGAQDTAGVTPLHAALDIAADATVAAESRLDCAMLLMRSGGADQLAVDALGKTARDYALKCDAAGAGLLEELDVRLAVRESLLEPVLFSYVCDCCSMAFAQLRELSEHKQTHDKPHACDEPGCGVRTAHRSGLKTHKRTHTGEKPYACDEPGCGFASVQQGNLTAHKRIHSGERPFVCDKPGCRFTSTRGTDLSVHKRKHTGERPFACSVLGCGFMCAQSGNLTKHKRTHTGERPYSCEVPGCGFRSAQTGNLAAHKRTHTGEKPYACDEPGCNFSTATRSYLKDHKKRRHT